MKAGEEGGVTRADDRRSLGLNYRRIEVHSGQNITPRRPSKPAQVLTLLRCRTGKEDPACSVQELEASEVVPCWVVELTNWV